MLWMNFILICIVATVSSYDSFADRLPNGRQVPDPCKAGSAWIGVGHKVPEGSGPRNQFGLDFLTNNNKWNKELCQKDSDSDGRTNGVELGDPDCIWTYDPNSPIRPKNTANITHPGICEPIDSHNCMTSNEWLKCSPAKSDCPSKFAPGVLNTTVSYPVTPIPAEETVYYCTMVKLPNDGLYDIIATEPVITDKNFVHHLGFFGCEDENIAANLTGIWKCPMGVVNGCSNVISLWGPGVDDVCYSSEYGVRIGSNANETAFKYAVLQIHYTNYELKPNKTDQSGMRIFYTAALRENRAKVLRVVQNFLFLPPGLEEVHQTAVCSSYCTNRSVEGSLFVRQAGIHMHMTGVKGSIELYRSGKYVQDIYPARDYDFYGPRIYMPKEAIEIKKGDEIRVNCYFNTIGRTNATYFGEGSRDEMCTGFMLYYPKPAVGNFIICGQNNKIGICGGSMEPICDRNESMKIVQKINLLCNSSSCTQECNKTVEAYKALGCASAAGLQANEMNNATRNVNVALDACTLEATPNCSLDAYALIVRNLEAHCRYDCNRSCANVVGDLGRSPCYATMLGVMKRRRVDLYGYVMSCGRDAAGVALTTGGGHERSTVGSQVSRASSTSVAPPINSSTSVAPPISSSKSVAPPTSIPRESRPNNGAEFVKLDLCISIFLLGIASFVAM